MQPRRLAAGWQRRLAATTAAVSAGLILTGTIALASPVNELVGPSWRNVYRADLSGDAAFTDIAAIGRSDAWAVGVRYSRTTAPTSAIAAHWSGHRWRLVSLPVRHFVAETVTASSAANVWILGFVIPPAGQEVMAGVALHLAGGKWQSVPLPPAPPETWNRGSGDAGRGGGVRARRGLA